MRPHFPLLTLLLLTLAACDSITGPDDPEATLSGKVTMASTGRGYHPATVALMEPDGDFEYDETNPEGQYRFGDVRPGHYTLILTLGNRGGAREHLREPIEIRAGDNVRDFVAP